MEKKLTSDLGLEYAKMLDARALSEIASWCEMASNACRKHWTSTPGFGPEDAERSDARIYAEAANALRVLQAHAHRKEAA